MKEKHPVRKKSVCIVTNNLHCERHVQYFSTIEKYFLANGWIIEEHFNVNKIVICACGFHDAMYEKILRTLKEIKQTYFLEKNIIITACLASTHSEDLEKNFNGQVVELLHEELLDDIIQAKIPFKEIRPVNVFNVHEKCKNLTNEFFHIKISRGCLRECTFCIINKAKGYITSVPYDEIAEQMQVAEHRGKKKVLLMGEDTFAYGIDSGTNIIELVEKLSNRFPGISLYFGYLHIRWLKKYAAEILALCRQGVFKELHIGLQHVNNEMLKNMGRPVVFSEIYDIITTLKRDLPDFHIVADIMVGFPGETDEMFDELVEFFKKDKCFNKVKHFGYSDVKGSKASQFADKVPQDIITARWECLDKILGERAYSGENPEPRLDDETFRITRFDDYSFCRNTFDEPLEPDDNSRGLAVSSSGILEEEKGDFGF